MFIIVPKHRQPTAPRHPNAAAAGLAVGEEEDRGPCNGQRPCGPCRRKHVICVFSRPKERNLPVSPAQATLLQHQQRRLRTAVQGMAAIIAKHERGVDAEPSSFDVLEQLDRYAPAEINDQDDCDDGTGQGATQPTDCTQVSAPRKRQKLDDLSPSVDSSDGAPTASPMFDLVPGPPPAAGSRPPTQGPTFETIMQYMQSMRDGTMNPTTSNNQVASSAAEGVPLNAGNLSQPLTTGSDPLTGAAPLQQEYAPFDFTSLIDWETSLANFEDDQLLMGSTQWNGDLGFDANYGNAAVDDAHSNSSPLQDS